jgi:hypothetical protein
MKLILASGKQQTHKGYKPINSKREKDNLDISIQLVHRGKKANGYGETPQFLKEEDDDVEEKFHNRF